MVLTRPAVRLVLEFLRLQGDQRYPSDLAAHPNLELQDLPWLPSEPEGGERGLGARGGRGPLCLPSHRGTLGCLVVLRNHHHLWVQGSQVLQARPALQRAPGPPSHPCLPSHRAAQAGHRGRVLRVLLELPPSRDHRGTLGNPGLPATLECPARGVRGLPCYRSLPGIRGLLLLRGAQWVRGGPGPRRQGSLGGHELRGYQGHLSHL